MLRMWERNTVERTIAGILSSPTEINADGKLTPHVQLGQTTSYRIGALFELNHKNDVDVCVWERGMRKKERERERERERMNERDKECMCVWGREEWERERENERTR